ncbi:hypothetical protein KCU59_g8, partial [Aureobasidium melanogenum]
MTAYDVRPEPRAYASQRKTSLFPTDATFFSSMKSYHVLLRHCCWSTSPNCLSDVLRNVVLRIVTFGVERDRSIMLKTLIQARQLDRDEYVVGVATLFVSKVQSRDEACDVLKGDYKVTGSERVPTLVQGLDTLVDGSNTIGQVLPTLTVLTTRDNETSLLDHIPPLSLAGESLDTLNKTKSKRGLLTLLNSRQAKTPPGFSTRNASFSAMSLCVKFRIPNETVYKSILLSGIMCKFSALASTKSSLPVPL